MMGNYNALYIPLYALSFIFMGIFFLLGSKTAARKGQKRAIVQYTLIAFIFYIGLTIMLLIWNPNNANTHLSLITGGAISINAFTAITQTPIGYMIKDKYAWDFAKRLIYEAVEVAEEDGTYFDRRQVLESVRQTCMRIADGYSSMYQDRRRKMKTEIDVINGAIVEQAKLYGVPVPYNSLIVDLVHAIEGAYEYYG